MPFDRKEKLMPKKQNSKKDQDKGAQKKRAIQSSKRTGSAAKKKETVEKKKSSRYAANKKSVKERAGAAPTKRSAPKKPSFRKIIKKKGAKVRVIPLGGLHEIGKNITLIECENDMIVVDCGFGFPDEDMLGVDLVIPDFSYLEANADKIKGIVLTHGHEDHIGGIPYLLRVVNAPIYGTRLTLGIIKNKLAEHHLPFQPTLNCVSAGDTVNLGESFSVEFIHVNHSIADACALAINTPV